MMKRSIRQSVAITSAILVILLFVSSSCSNPRPTSVYLVYQSEGFSHQTITDKMTFVQGGTFNMGAETLMPDERPVHQVTVSSFLISRTEVTQEEWMAVMGGNPSHFQNKAYPVEMITWYDAINFTNKLSVMEGLEPVYSFQGGQVVWDRTKNGYRLPTEAEWEFAARGGIRTMNYLYSGSNDVSDVAQHTGNVKDDLNKPVASLKPNELGLYDMSGNVYEWVWDWKAEFTEDHQTDPSGKPNGEQKAVRGGSAFCAAYSNRISWRNSYEPGTREYYIGLRVARNRN